MEHTYKLSVTGIEEGEVKFSEIPTVEQLNTYFKERDFAARVDYVDPVPYKVRSVNCFFVRRINQHPSITERFKDQFPSKDTNQVNNIVEYYCSYWISIKYCN